MITTRYTSLSRILEKVRTDYGLEDVYAAECKEWIWDVIGTMAAPELLITKTRPIKIKEWRGTLPVDVFNLNNHMVKEPKSGRIMSITDNLFMSDSRVRDAGTIVTKDESVNMEDGDRVPGTEYISIISTKIDNLDYSYQIRGDYIFTAIKEMEVELTYTAFPMDEDKMEPLIPDEPKTIKAVTAYLAMMIARRLKFNNKIDRYDYELIEREYLFTVASAITSARTQSLPEIENLKNRTLQLVKQTQSFNRGFR